MKIREAVSKLEKSKEFKDFKKGSDHYLVHAFRMISQGKDDWQLGYYSEDTDKVVVFEVGSEITRKPEEKVLKQGDTVKELDLDKVKLEAEGAFKVAMDHKEEKHHGESVTKKIIILQNIEEGIVYNTTLVTTNFNIINMKIDAASGKILKESKESIMKLGKPAPK